MRASLRRRLAAEHCETSCERLSCGIQTSAECFKASLPLLPGSSRAPSTSEPSPSLISGMSLARGRHHHVLDLALLRPTGCGSAFTPRGTSSGTSAPASLCWSVQLGCSGTLHYLQQHFITCPRSQSLHNYFNS